VSVLDLAKRENLPCCTFTALALLEADGAEITSIDDGPRARGLEWWKDANVWDPTRPWSALDAAREITGAADLRVQEVLHTAPPLRAGRWHLVQRWRNLDPGETAEFGDDLVKPGQSTGHTYLAHLADDGVCRIVQSSVNLGYRDTTGTWTGSAGLTGYAVGVVYLPEGWSWGG